MPTFTRKLHKLYNQIRFNYCFLHIFFVGYVIRCVLRKAPIIGQTNYMPAMAILFLHTCETKSCLH